MSDYYQRLTVNEAILRGRMLDGEGLYWMDALEARAIDYVMPDLQRIGSVTAWLRAAAITPAYGMEMSSHLLPEYSAHLLAVTPTSHWLEYMDRAPPRSLPSLCRSRTDMPSFPIGRAAASRGTRTRSSVTP